jgi:hypothetical protein
MSRKFFRVMQDQDKGGASGAAAFPDPKRAAHNRHQHVNVTFQAF